MNTSKALILVAVICFTLASFGVVLPVITLVPMGLGFFAASFLVQ